MNSFPQCNTKVLLQKVLDLLHFGFCQNWMTAANLVAETQLKLLNERVLKTGEPCTYEYITLLQLFPGTLKVQSCKLYNNT